MLSDPDYFCKALENMPGLLVKYAMYEAEKKAPLEKRVVVDMLNANSFNNDAFEKFIANKKTRPILKVASVAANKYTEANNKIDSELDKLESSKSILKKATGYGLKTLKDIFLP